ncbi:L-arabinose transport system permease protein AraQ [Paenibacillus allorhizoplanae]|uniref:L-arabinose transport system permease protein AraQ n=1 Tax=Paenibacillus allorhizoplanae TaxID=2905648 RepID=A0ABM9BRP5_9BACL|nr:carbohydrate ABC transporter permease [Paenibacillus allorhizoplanae]CAH1191521.1 L-arabinose transport system permease protein AraQ [Paenibacillus allorhizoplanae]
MFSKSYRRENRISPLAETILNVIFILLSLACVLPVILVIIVSVTHNDSLINEGYSFFPSKYSLIAYQTVFKDFTTMANAYKVSIGITVVGTLLSVLLMALYAYPLSRKDYPYRTVFTFFLFFTMLFNGGIVSRYMIYTQTLHLKDSYMALILPLLIVPFNVIIMRTFFQSTIHPALIESARIDGAGELRIFLRIVLPLSLPVLATMALFSTINYWNDWFNALLFINKEHMYPIQFLMLRVLKDVQYIRENLTVAAQNPELLKNLPNESLQMALAFIAMGPILIVYPFFQKYFVKGLTVGAVKG